MSAARRAATERFRELFGRPPELLVRAPGRVNLLGGHVDYNDGWVLPAAIDRAIWLAAGAIDEPLLRAESLDFEGLREIALDPTPGPPEAAGRPLSDWIEYPSGVAWALSASGHSLSGLEAVVASELPVGAGVSSSAAIEVAFLLAWREIGGSDLDRTTMARLGQHVENDYLGVQSGIMDQFASLHGAAGQAVFLDCRTLDWERLPLPAGTAVLVADSGVRRRLVDGAINDRRSECEEALAALRRDDPDLQALRDVRTDRLDVAVGPLQPRLARRVRHVVEECARVRRGAALLREAGGDAAAFGALMLTAHASSRDLYEVSIPEIDLLVETAAVTPGCHGARLSGAGFGGCVTALVNAQSIGAVEAALCEAFEGTFGRRPVCHRCTVADGAGVVDP